MSVVKRSMLNGVFGFVVAFGLFVLSLFVGCGRLLERDSERGRGLGFGLVFRELLVAGGVVLGVSGRVRVRVRGGWG